MPLTNHLLLLRYNNFTQAAEVYQPAAVLQHRLTRGLVGDSNKLDRSSDVNLDDPGWVEANSSS